MRPEQIDGGNGDFGDPPDSSFGGTPLGPTAPGTDTDPDPDPLSGFIGHAPLASYAGGLLAGPAGMFGLGLLGAYTDVERAEEALAEEYGANPPGYPRGYDPELSTWDTFLNAVSPFGIFGESAAEALAREVAHMEVVDLENPLDYQAEAEAEAAAEEAVGSFDPFSPGGWSTGWGEAAVAAAEAEAEAAAEASSAWGGGAGDAGGPGGKIACTMMTRLYGVGSFRNAVWMRYARDHMPEPEWELGYHKVYGPLVKMMPAHPWVRKFMRWFARTRTATLRRELRGKRPTFMQAVRRGVSRSP